MEQELFIYKNIIQGMTEGVITISMDGCITSMNQAAMDIMDYDDSVIGKKFATVFFIEEENDAFNQAVLDAIYQNTVRHNNFLKFKNGDVIKHLFVSTSYLKKEDAKIGVVVVFSDITEIHELRDALKAMEKIRELNKELEKRNEFIKGVFGRYLSDEIVKSILGSDKGLVIGGQKQNVTIMFTDLRGFTAISEKMSPTDLIHMLNEYLKRMIEIIQRWRGTILEFIGDAIVVVFGAPLCSDTCNYDAVACAIEMQNDMVNVNEYNLSHDYPCIEMGIGIHYGEVVLGNIGSEKKTKYDIIGKNVNLASRIETYTVGGQIFISENVQAKLGSKLITEEPFQIIPKGVKKPVNIYEVIALDDFRKNTVQRDFIVLDKPIPVTFSYVIGKDILEEKYECEVTERAQDQIIIKNYPLDKEIEKYLKPKQNILILLNKNEIYGKILKVNPDSILVHITAGDMGE